MTQTCSVKRGTERMALENLKMVLNSATSSGRVTELDISCVVVCCGVLQCVVVCCGVLQRGVKERCEHGSSHKTWYQLYCGVLHCVAACLVCCSVLRCVAVWCSITPRARIDSQNWTSAVLQCVAVCCGVLQCGIKERRT